MNQCPVELQKEQFHWRRLVSDLRLFQEVWLHGIAKYRGSVGGSSDGNYFRKWPLDEDSFTTGLSETHSVRLGNVN